MTKTAAFDGIQTVDRVMKMLSAFDSARRELGVSDFAQMLGVHKSTASRLLTALERHGLVHQAGERGKLEPGPAILRFAHRGGVERHLVELAHQSLEALSRASVIKSRPPVANRPSRPSSGPRRNRLLSATRSRKPRLQSVAASREAVLLWTPNIWAKSLTPSSRRALSKAESIFMTRSTV